MEEKLEKCEGGGFDDKVDSGKNDLKGTTMKSVMRKVLELMKRMKGRKKVGRVK